MYKNTVRLYLLNIMILFKQISPSLKSENWAVAQKKNDLNNIGRMSRNVSFDRKALLKLYLFNYTFEFHV